MTASQYPVSSWPKGAPGEHSIALIGPDEKKRLAARRALSDCRCTDVVEFSDYPEQLNELPRMLEAEFDMIIIDLDAQPETALDVIENICVRCDAIVMAYSAGLDEGLLVRCMQAGTREFLTVPFKTDELKEALARARARRTKVAPVRDSKLLVFMGVKGGVGATSIACNFAVALAQDRSKRTLLIDLDLPLGDAALNLGVTSEFSTANALEEADRLDSALLLELLAKHESGLHVLAAPGQYPYADPGTEGIERLLSVARSEFDYVVVDAGSRIDIADTSLHHNASTIYLVTQPGIPELRNANRLINQVFSDQKTNVEIVLNRFQSKTIGISEEQINKALTRPAVWKIPNDHAVIQKMQQEGSPLVFSNAPIAQTIRDMAQSVTGQPESAPAAKNNKGLLGIFAGNSKRAVPVFRNTASDI
jgi:pilus assembly protein CpaE